MRRITLHRALLLQRARIERNEVLVLIVRFEDLDVRLEYTVRSVRREGLLQESEGEDEVSEEAKKMGEGAVKGRKQISESEKG